MISKQQQNMAILDDEVNFVQNSNMQEMPTNLSLDKNQQNCDSSVKNQDQTTHTIQNLVPLEDFSDKEKIESINENVPLKTNSNQDEMKEFSNETRIQLSFSVDRLLSNKTSLSESSQQHHYHKISTQSSDDNKCCNELNNSYSCCSLPNCLVNTTTVNSSASLRFPAENAFQNTEDIHMMTSSQNVMDFKSIVRPTPMRAMGNNSDQAISMAAPYTAMTPTNLIRLHHAQIHQKQMHPHLPAQTNFSLTALMSPLCGIKQMPTTTQQMGLQSFPVPTPVPNSRYASKSSINFDIPGMRPSINCIPNLRHHHLVSTASNETHMNFANVNTTAGPTGSNSNATNSPNNVPSHTSTSINNSNGKRKRSWSRAVFSNLQRKGLEIQFQQQKYITKPDRRKLAARLNLTDAQVKVWFQNRRMKWRHTRENLKSGQEKQPTTSENIQPNSCLKVIVDGAGDNGGGPGYSSDGSSSLEMSDCEDDEDEIDVVE